MSNGYSQKFLSPSGAVAKALSPEFHLPLEDKISGPNGRVQIDQLFLSQRLYFQSRCLAQRRNSKPSERMDRKPHGVLRHSGDVRIFQEGPILTWPVDVCASLVRTRNSNNKRPKGMSGFDGVLESAI